MILIWAVHFIAPTSQFRRNLANDGTRTSELRWFGLAANVEACSPLLDCGLHDRRTLRPLQLPERCMSSGQPRPSLFSCSINNITC